LSEPLVMDNRFFLGSLILVFLLAMLNSLFFPFLAIFFIAVRVTKSQCLKISETKHREPIE